MGSHGDVPLSSIPKDAYSANTVGVALASLGLLAFLCYDIHLSRKRKALWVPGILLLWSSLTVTLLGLVDRSYLVISNYKPLDHDDVETFAKYILHVQVLMVSSKVVVCVFVAYTIPGFYSESGWRLWSRVLSLFINVAIVVTRGAYEIFILVLRSQLPDNGIPTVSFVVSDAIIIVCSSLLFACLICSLLASSSITAMADLRTPLLFNEQFHEDKGDLLNRPQWSWPIIKHKLLKFCVVVRTWQPQYVIARSTMTSLLFFIVTWCLLVLFWQLQYCHYSNVEDYFEPGYVLYLPVQVGFILVAWGVIGMRWITAIIYQPRLLLYARKTPRFLSNMSQLRPSRMVALRKLFVIEDYWLRTCKDVAENPEMMLEEEEWWALWVTTIISGLHIHKLISAICFFLQCIVIWSSKVTWLFSEILLIFPESLASIVTGHEVYKNLCADAENVLSISNQNSKDEDGGQIEREGIIANTEEHTCDIQSVPEPAKGAAVNEISEFSSCLLFMTGETPNGILLANRGFMSMLETKFNQEREKGMNSTLQKLLRTWVWERNEYENQKILDIAQKYLEDTVEDFDLGCGSLKMTVVCLLRVMVEVSECYKKEDQDVSEWISACKEAWPIMDYVENSPPNCQASVIIRNANALFKELRQTPRMWLNHELNEMHSIDTWVEIKHMLERLKAPGASSHIKSGFDTRRWKREMAEANLTRVCDLLLSELSEADGISNLLEQLNTAMAVVIALAVRRTHQAFSGKLKWLNTLPFPDEEKFWKICSTIAFAVGVCTDAPVRVCTDVPAEA